MKLKDTMFRTESTKCPNCGEIIKWNSDEHGNIWRKIRYHQNNKQCIRKGKLKELLGDDEVKTNYLNLTFLD